MLDKKNLSLFIIKSSKQSLRVRFVNIILIEPKFLVFCIVFCIVL